MNLAARITEKDVGGETGLSSKKPRRAARAVLFDSDNRIAVICTARFNLYSLPGVGIEAGETPEAAVRERFTKNAALICRCFGMLREVKANEQ
ncbi:MAG: NUDIX hydrolase [Eubacteriales bacterium]|nr:NUDIX hydrolase [Eubacteriales bacterium]MDD3882441.1 NUDIX hydrolase [Eubacteriales bacterium]MDD4513163.1 NUDIX hydrolase [Eubacteriales bacterium]